MKNEVKEDVEKLWQNLEEKLKDNDGIKVYVSTEIFVNYELSKSLEEVLINKKYSISDTIDDSQIVVCNTKHDFNMFEKVILNDDCKLFMINDFINY